MARQTHPDGVDLIKHFESLRLSAYQDSIGIWSIGYGHTDGGKNTGKITRGMTIDEPQAEAYLRADLDHFEQAVGKIVTCDLNDNQFAALVSFSFNLGEGNLNASTLLKKLNAGDYFGAAGEFRQWSKAGGKRLAGLLRRRLSERNLFCSFPNPVVAELPADWAEIYDRL